VFIVFVVVVYFVIDSVRELLDTLVHTNYGELKLYHFPLTQRVSTAP